MSEDQTLIPKPRRPRVRLPVLLLAALAVGGGLIVRHGMERTPNQADILGVASAYGVQLAPEHPTQGTHIFQWDPELSTIPPFDIGPVVATNVPLEGHLYTKTKRPHYRALLLDIHKSEMRYWVRKPDQSAQK